jgi:hypothetical protein
MIRWVRSIALTATSTAQKKAATAASPESPKRHTQPPTSNAVASSTAG